MGYRMRYSEFCSSLGLSQSESLFYSQTTCGKMKQKTANSSHLRKDDKMRALPLEVVNYTIPVQYKDHYPQTLGKQAKISKQKYKVHDWELRFRYSCIHTMLHNALL